MRYQELLILLPCHSLEDFPTHHDSLEAEGLLSHWTALWHPTLIQSAGQAPRWIRVDDPPNEFEERLIAVPNVAKDRLPTGYPQRAKEGGAILLRNLVKRTEIVAAALAPLGGSNVSDDLAADFLALGYAYLEVQLLTRQMRYSSSLDDLYFKSQVVAAAQAAAAGDVSLANERLSSCFSLLAEERDRYYPVDAYLIDITMLADTTLGAALRNHVQRMSPVNLLLGAAQLEQMAQREPDTLSLLQAGRERGELGLIGGEIQENRLPLQSYEEVLESLVQGDETYVRHLGKGPIVFGRRRFGLSPGLPQILRKRGFIGALHATLEDGRFPEGTQLKVGWEGSDGTTLDAIARAPLDASQAKTFLQLATKLGESMDQDHVATLLLAHWPGQASPFYEDLRRTAKYSVCLGRFATVEQYFQDSTSPGQRDRFEVDKYKSPYLKQSVIRKLHDPISTTANYWKSRALWESAEALATLANCVSGKVAELPLQMREELLAAEDPRSATATGANAPFLAESTPARLVERMLALRQAQGERLGRLICPQASSTRGYLFLNPYACVRRAGFDHLEMPCLPAPEKPVYAVGEISDRKQAVADVPAFGFAWLAAAEQPIKTKKAAKPLAESPNILRNEFFEAVISTTTGALQSVHEYNSRRNRISQQLALRTPGPAGKAGDVYRDPDEAAEYSVMGADSVEITAATAALGEITVVGRLMNQQGESVATYAQVYRVWRGSRVLHLEITLKPLVELKSDPWNSYFGCRFAWGDEASELVRTVHQQRSVTTTKFMESPHYIEIDAAEKRTAILTGGLPFHRRTGPAIVDTLLIVRGETARTFTLGIGIDLPHPMHEAMALLAPPLAIPMSARPPASGNSGWLLHLDSRNVITTHVQVLTQRDRVIGFRARLLETSGRAADLSVSAFRSISKANKLDFRQQPLQECTIEDGKAKLNVSAHEWLELEAYW